MSNQHAPGINLWCIRRVVTSCIVAGGVLSGALLVGGCEEKDAKADFKAEVQTVPVALASAKMQTVARTVEVTGTLWGDQDITISAKVPGRVAEIFKDVGDRVKPGETLVQIDQTDYELSRTTKALAVDELLARLGLKDFPADDFDAAKVPTVRRAGLQAENAEARYNRGKQLHDQQPPLISDQDFADLATAWEVAKSGYDVELLTARSLLTEASSRRADLAIATQQLSDTTLKAPRVIAPVATGTTQTTTAPASMSYGVASRMISVGEYVREGTALYRLVADDPIKFRGYVPERYSGQIKVGQQVKLRVDAYKQHFTGTLTRINPQVDPASRSFLVEAVISNPQRQLQPGSFTRASIETSTEQAIFVPAAAVVTFAGSSKVFVVNDGKAKEILVETGDTRDGMTELSSGLKKTVEVVVKGNNRLATGVPVKLEAATAATQPVAAK